MKSTKKRRAATVFALSLLAGLAGFAVAQAQGPEESPGLPASACPDAAAAFVNAGQSVDTFGPECPSGADVASVVQEAKRIDAARAAAEAAPRPEILDARNCAAQTALLEKAGLPVDGFGAGRCPTVEEVTSLIEGAQVFQAATKEAPK